MLQRFGDVVVLHEYYCLGLIVAAESGQLLVLAEGTLYGQQVGMGELFARFDQPEEVGQILLIGNELLEDGVRQFAEDDAAAVVRVVDVFLAGGVGVG